MPIIKRRSWGFQNTPNLQNSDYFEPSYCNWKKIEVFQNWFDWLICKSSFCATSFFAVFLANTHQKDDFWGCFGIVRISSCWWAQRFSKSMQKWLRKLKLKLALWTQKSIFWLSVTFQMRVANFNFNFLSHFCIDFENLCAHQQEEILKIPKHPQTSTFWWVLTKKTAKNKEALKID